LTVDAPAPTIAYSDEHLAVVDKPAGLLVHAAPGNDGPTLVEALGDLLGGGEDPERPGIVHRLDRDTSGLLVVARTARAHTELSRMIAAREVTREYVALVEGCPPSRTGKVDAALGRDHRSPERVVVGGRRPRSAVTHFEVREMAGSDALVDVRLETGRTHQIRVHMQAIGHPIAGDPQYGGRGRHGLTRQVLHSRRIAFDHPLDDVRIDLESPLPADLSAALEVARADPADSGRGSPVP
jgi:23S rRNA pseudouridine1911/1915/1917 synthase